MDEDKTSRLDRAIALNAFKVLCPQEALRLTDTHRLIGEVDELGESGLDRFGILTVMLEKRGIATDTRVSWRYMGTLERRHAEARARVEKLAPRTDENAVQFDEAHTAELTLHNAIMAAFEDAETDLVSVLNMAGLDYRDAEALLSLKPGQRLRYETDDVRAEAYRELIGWDLATNISSHFPGSSLGITLSGAGELVWRLVMGQRKVGR